MAGRTVRISSSAKGAAETGEFDCYVSLPASGGKVPAIVVASAVHGVDKDICDLAEEFASHGFIAAAPDLFWRGLPGPIPGATHARASARSRESKKSRQTKRTWRTPSPTCARCRNLMAALPPRGFATAARSQSSGRSGSAMLRAFRATALAWKPTSTNLRA